MNPQGAIAYQTAQGIGNNLAGAFQKRRDENSIESILTEASQTGDPQVIQNTIGKILSSVSPERQGPALQYLQMAYKNVQEKQQQSKQANAAKSVGVNPDLPAALQTAQFKENAKQGRINQIYGNSANPQQPTIENPGPTKNAPQSGLSGRSREELTRLTGHPDKEISEPAKAELKELDTIKKEEGADKRAMRKETLPLRQEIIDRANRSRESIRNKTHLLNIIDKGNLDDPTFAIFAESLPFDLGKRLLSEDTVEYKGGLVDEFSDLKNIFKGATRVKEVEIYENKLADTYLTDSQKKAILKSRINSAKIDLLREEAAAEVEEEFPNISALQFNRKVDEKLASKSNDLFNTIWDEQKAIIDQSEARKKLPLNAEDPEDLEIIDQILREANGNYIEAEKLAKKKGYKF